jgi:hypothetical protein
VPAVKRLNLTEHRDLFEVFPLERGPEGLAAVLRRRLEH